MIQTKISGLSTVLSLSLLVLVGIPLGRMSVASGAPASLPGSILFLRGGYLWQMGVDGSKPRQIMSAETLGSFSVSTGGRIVYDGFKPLDREPKADLNVYLIEDLLHLKPLRLTSDNQSVYPRISPDGRFAVFEKLRWTKHAGADGTGEGLWIADLSTKATSLLAGVLPIPKDLQLRRTKIGKVSLGTFDEKKWSRDRVTWAPSGDRLVFSRFFRPGGLIPFWTEVPARHPAQLLPERIVQALDFNGDTVIWDANATEYRLRSYTLKDKNTEGKILVEDAFIATAKFSPDGRFIAYYTPPDSQGHEGLWVIPSQGGEKVRLPDFSTGDVSWSGDSKTLFFVRVPDGSPAVSEIWAANPDGSGLRKLADDGMGPIWLSVPNQ